MRTLIITGGSFDKEFAASFLRKNKYDYVIAVDGGLKYAKELGLKVDLAAGDFDTYTDVDFKKCEESGIKILKFNPEKDDTDTEIAVREAVRLGHPMDILFATGGRVDHFLSNIGNLSLAAAAKVSARIVEKNNIISMFTESFELSREEFPFKYVSFFPFGGIVKNIKIKGFKYTLDGYDLKPGISRCVSNEFLNDKGAVTFDEGIIIAVNSSDIKSE